MCLQDFEHLDHRDQICIIAALEHNTWFTKLKASGAGAGVRLPADICDRIIQVAAKSTSLQELHVSSIGARADFAARLAQAVAANQESALTSIDLSCNVLEDKGLNHISSSLAKHRKGLHHVNFSHCALGAKGMSNFAAALAANRANLRSLTYLNLSGNALKEESQALCSFLTSPNTVAILDLSSAETPLDALFGALVHGCVASLTHLNLSRNVFSSKKSKGEIPPAFKQFFAATRSLQYLNLSQCKLPSEAVKHLLLGLACNDAVSNVELNMSNNSLGANGATVIENCMGEVKCVARLDLSDNNIEAEMAGVMQGVTRGHSVLSLNVSRNMTNVKPKHLPAVMESIVQLIQDEETVLQKLNLSDCKLRSEVNNVINALGSNQSLQHLDISGNGMGDVGARLLAKALQINTRLRIVNLDRNGVTLQGLTDVTYALQSNYSMRHIPFPTYDLQPFVKTHPDRVDSLIHRMQELLQRNANPHRFRNTAQAFRLTQGFLLSSTQQILDRVSAQAQDNIDALGKLNPDIADDSEDVEVTRGLIRDAENSKYLLSALHEATARGAEVDVKLKQLSGELTSFMTAHVERGVEAMLECAKQQCPRVMDRSSASSGASKSEELRNSCQKKCQISSEFVTGLVVDQLGREVHNKINELNLIIANHISDRVIDEVIEGLGQQSKTLVSEVGSLRKKRSLTPDALGSRGSRSTSVSESLERESLGGGAGAGSTGGDGVSQKSESSPLNTPQTSKRKSLHEQRKLRPRSVADRKEDDAAKDITASPSVLSELSKGEDLRNGAPEEDSVPDLPSTTSLQHLGKARPRRAKRHAPSRGAVVGRQPSDGDGGEENDDGGLSRFYSSSANSSFSPGSTPSGSPLHEMSPRGTSLAAASASTPTSGLVRGDEVASSLERRIGSLGASSKQVSSPELSRKSPLPPASKQSRSEKSRVGGGLSCLSAQDDGGGSVVGPALIKPSPERRALSPSLHSITDIFSRKDKQPSPKPENKSVTSGEVVGTSPSGVSPFASRKTDSELLSAAAKRRSLNPAAAGTDDSVGVLDDGGKRTPEAVIKRHGVGHGGNPDLLAEMREKRASMAPKTSASITAEGELSPPPGRVADGAAEDDKSRSMFGHVKLR